MASSLVRFIVLFASFACSQSRNVVTTLADGSKIRGIYDQDNRVKKYLGIPYTQPPVGDLRFEDPVPPASWRGTMNTTTIRPCCVQLDANFFGFSIRCAKQSEDCLYLNLYIPSRRQSKLLPVMLWIHGGGYTMGNGTITDGTKLARHGQVIVVTINYRLNVFGFFKHGNLSNQGIKDQQMALQWVQQHIKQFGGDPNQVTIFGESAGSGSVAHQILSPTAKGLFNRAIMESGTSNSVWGTQLEVVVAQMQMVVAQRVGCFDNATKTVDLNCFKDADAQELVQATKDLFFGPTPDGVTVLPSALTLDPSSQPANDVDILIGYNSNEGFMMLTFLWNMFFYYSANMTDPNFVTSRDRFDEGVVPLTQLFLQETDPKSPVTKAIQDKYGANATTPRDRIEALDDLYSDIMFNIPSVGFARYMDQKGSKNVYFYEFNHTASFPLFGMPEWMGSIHGIEIAFVFGLAPMEWISFDNVTGAERLLSHRMMDYWTTFAKSGHPEDDDWWPQYSVSGGGKYFKISGTGAETCSNLMEDFYDFWIQTIPQLKMQTSQQQRPPMETRA